MDKNDALKLDNQLCFALYTCSKEIIRLYKPFLDPIGLTYTQYITLLVLWEEDNISVSDLGTKLFIDSGTITPLLKRLENAQLLTRIRSSADERRVTIRLTPKGQELKENFYDLPARLFCSSGMEINEALQLKNLLSSTLSKLQNADALCEEKL